MRTKTELAIRVRSLPGFTAVEDVAVLYGNGHRLDHAADAFSKQHFKIARDDLFDFFLDVDTIYPDDIEAMIAENPGRLLADFLTDDELVDYLLKYGFDLRDDRGHPLRCTKAIAAQIEAVARGFAGEKPKQEDIETENFRMRMTADAAAFSAKKRSRT